MFILCYLELEFYFFRIILIKDKKNKCFAKIIKYYKTLFFEFLDNIIVDEC